MNRSGRTNPFIHRQPLKTGGRGPFMERVRKGLGHSLEGAAILGEDPPVRDESVIRQCAANDPDRVNRWIERANANTMQVVRAAGNGSAVRAAIDSCFANHKVAKTILNAHELESQFQLSEYLAARHVEVIPWGSANCREASFECDASITDCRAGLADAGSILVWSDRTFGRSSTLVMPVHILLLPASRIVGDMIDGLELVMRECNGQLPSNVVIINGPSKTADIEMNLVTGVHGPKFLYVLVIDGL